MSARPANMNAANLFSSPEQRWLSCTSKMLVVNFARLLQKKKFIRSNSVGTWIMGFGEISRGVLERHFYLKYVSVLLLNTFSASNGGIVLFRLTWKGNILYDTFEYFRRRTLNYINKKENFFHSSCNCKFYYIIRKNFSCTWK